jgi:hypothetical protein|nr:MAG TPA: hypothetical protein [Caudoviricetes sp.]
MLSLQEIYNNVLSLFPGNKFAKIQTTTLDLLDSIEEDIREDLLPSLDLMLDNPIVLKASEKTNFYRLVKDSLKCHSLESLLKDFEYYVNDFVKNIDKVENLVKANLNNSINAKTMTFKQYSTYRLVEDTKSNILVIMKLLYLLIRDEKNSVLPQKQVIKTLKALPELKNKVLNKPSVKKAIDEITSMASESVFDGVSSGAPEASVLSDVRKPAISGFIGHPVLLIRQYLVELEFKRLDYLKNIRNSIELRLLELKTQIAGGDVDPKLQGQIEYYEDQLASIDAKIEKMETID